MPSARTRVRKVKFFAVITEGTQFDAKAFVAQLSEAKTVDFSDGDKSYRAEHYGDDGRPAIRISVRRLQDEPLQELSGRVTPLQLPPGANVVEQISVLVRGSEDRTILAMEYDHHGPRQGAFAALVEHLTEVRPLLRPIIQRDAENKLATMRTINAATIELSPSETMLQSKALGPSLEEVLRDREGGIESRSIKVTFAFDSRKQSPGQLERLIRWAKRTDKRLENVRIEGTTEKGERELFSVSAPQIKGKITVALMGAKSGCSQREDARLKLDACYSEHRHDLLTGAVILVAGGDADDDV